MSSDEAQTYFEEATALAVDLNDTRANARIHAAYGRILANGGSADEYVGKLLEAKEIADRSNDISAQITMNAVLCDAYRLAGRMSDALAVNVEATNRAHEIVRFDSQTLGFDVEIWLSAMRGQTLVMLGRGDEARPYLDRILQLHVGQVHAIHYVIPSLAYIDFAWTRDYPNLAHEHANRAYSLALMSGDPYLRVCSQAARGLAHITARKFNSAIKDLSDALSFARQRRAGLESESRILADLSYAYSQTGEISLAVSTSREAIEVAINRNARVAECLARIVRGGLLIGQGKQEGSADLVRAEELIEETGAVILKPLLESATAASHDKESSGC